ncbi:MAG: ImmA/IrrE family metallo-endopeptidase [Solirubrobacteraceae bacterium]
MRASARAVLVCELARTLEAYVQLPAVRLPSVPLGEDNEPLQADDAAAAARVELGVALGPVPNVVRLLEAHGALVMRLRIDDQRVSAFSQWFDGRPLVALGSDRDDAGRSRFDAAHELGHLVMHPEPEAGNALLERQADRFAASFLMPADDIALQLPDWMSSAYGRRREPEPLAHEHPVLLWRATQLAFPSDPVSGLS